MSLHSRVGAWLDDFRTIYSSNQRLPTQLRASGTKFSEACVSFRLKCYLLQRAAGQGITVESEVGVHVTASGRPADRMPGRVDLCVTDGTAAVIIELKAHALASMADTCLAIMMRTRRADTWADMYPMLRKRIRRKMVYASEDDVRRMWVTIRIDGEWTFTTIEAVEHGAIVQLTHYMLSVARTGFYNDPVPVNTVTGYTVVAAGFNVLIKDVQLTS